MIRHALVALILYVLFAVQVGWPHSAGNSLASVWLPGLALIVCVELFEGAALLTWAACVGLVVDSLSLDQLGINLLMTTLLAIIISGLRTDGRASTITSVVVMTLITTFVWRFSRMAVLNWLELQNANVEDFAFVAIKNALSNGVIVWIVMCSISGCRTVFARDSGHSLSLRNRWTMLTNQ